MSSFRCLFHSFSPFSCFPSVSSIAYNCIRETGGISALLDEKCKGQTHIISVLMETSHSCLTLLLLCLLLDFACLTVAYGILLDCWTCWPPTQQYCASISPSLTAPSCALQQLFSPVPLSPDTVQSPIPPHSISHSHTSVTFTAEMAQVWQLARGGRSSLEGTVIS